MKIVNRPSGYYLIAGSDASFKAGLDVDPILARWDTEVKQWFLPGQTEGRADAEVFMLSQIAATINTHLKREF